MIQCIAKFIVSGLLPHNSGRAKYFRIFPSDFQAPGLVCAGRRCSIEKIEVVRFTCPGKNGFHHTVGVDHVFGDAQQPVFLQIVQFPCPVVVNADGKFSVTDLVMMQKFLLNNGELTDWKAGDLCSDEIIDVFDMVMMRQLILK